MYRYEESRKKNRAAALALVVLMLAAVPAVAMATGTDEADATPADYYKYVMTYSGTTISKVDVYTSADGTPTAVTQSMDSIWDFDDDGYGPFNSFYAAISTSTGKIVYHLDPSDLTKTVDGQAFDPTSTAYNVMWVIPTVYWADDGNGHLTMSNDPSEGTAYAHTKSNNGHVYNYIALGVYQSSQATIGGTTMAVSVSGAAPLTNVAYATARTYTQNNTVDGGTSIMMNFYQWTLAKMAAYTVTLSMDMRNTVGTGNTTTGSAQNSGQGDTHGPFYANTYGNKAFVENMWGNVYTIIADALVVNGHLWVGQRTGQGVSTDYKTDLGAVPTSNGWEQTFYRDSAAWDYPLTVGTTSSLAYYNGTSSTTAKMILAGGDSSTSDANVNRLQVAKDFTLVGTWFGSRLAMYLDDDPTRIDITYTVDEPTYGTITTSGMTYVPAGSTVTISGNTLTIDGRTITAEPTASDDQYTYALDGFYAGDTKLATGDAISADTAITVKFSRTVNTYTVTFTVSGGFGGVSTASVSDVPYGTPITVSDMTVTLGAYGSSEALLPDDDAQYAYAFDGWTIGGQEIAQGASVSDDTAVVASFSRTVNAYDVPITLPDASYGTLTATVIEGVPYGTPITISDMTVTLGAYGSSEAAVSEDDAQYTYAWAGWMYGGQDVESGTTAITGADPIVASITATLNRYTVTWVIGEESSTEQYDYGATPSHEDPEAPEGKEFKGWDPSISPVTGDITYTARFGAPADDAMSLVMTAVEAMFLLGIVVYIGNSFITGRISGREAAAMMAASSIAMVIFFHAVMPAIGSIR